MGLIGRISHAELKRVVRITRITSINVVTFLALDTGILRDLVADTVGNGSSGAHGILNIKKILTFLAGQHRGILRGIVVIEAI